MLTLRLIQKTKLLYGEGEKRTVSRNYHLDYDVICVLSAFIVWESVYLWSKIFKWSRLFVTFSIRTLYSAFTLQNYVECEKNIFLVIVPTEKTDDARIGFGEDSKNTFTSLRDSLLF